MVSQPPNDCVACNQNPAWIKPVLLAAAVYNLVFGAWAVLFPAASLKAIGLPADSPGLPLVWSCVGMIVGVYGVGYWLAARQPVTLWAMVFVGLLGKILGPMGFVWGLWTGQAPLQMGWLLIFNDLIWWGPFAAILWHAFVRLHGNADGAPSDWATTPSQVSATLMSAIAQNGESIDDVSREPNGALVVCLRHAGCTFCREMVASLAEAMPELEQAKLHPVIVHQNEPEQADAWLGNHPVLKDVPRVSDPSCQVYRSLGLTRGGFLQLFGPKVWLASLRAAKFGVGKLQGDGLQMPGVVWVEHGKVLDTQRFQHAGEQADWSRFVEAAQTRPSQPQSGGHLGVRHGHGQDHMPGPHISHG